MENFRNYSERTTIKFNDLTAIIGKNDVGKSSILEALDIFFDNRKIDSEDASVHTSQEDTLVSISCEFIEFPKKLILDSKVETSLASEYCLNSAGRLEIVQKFDCSKKSITPSVFLKAKHPENEKVNDLLILTQAKLKALGKELGIEFTNHSVNSIMRREIWQHFESKGELSFSEQEIPLNKEDAKKTWASLKQYLPIFALFQSDRKSEDSDSEIQDPMKLAIKEAVAELTSELSEIEEKIQKQVEQVAKNTLDKLKEMDKELAQDLKPYFKAERKWDSLFKLSIEDDNRVPMNKRGSGVRRLITLSFFRAEAERKRKEKNFSNIIYAFEEPENSQHPDNQKMLIEAFQSLAEEEGCQVILTTHNPALAESILVEDLRFIYREKVPDNERPIVKIANEEDLSTNIRLEIAQTLGLFPSANLNKVKVLVCVEGKHDISFLRTIGSIIHQTQPDLIDLAQEESNDKLIFIPLGGSQLKIWVAENYLKQLSVPQFYIFDGDVKGYRNSASEVNSRDNTDMAVITSKRELENYLHQDAIKTIEAIEVVVDDEGDVPERVAKALHAIHDESISWEDLCNSDSANLKKKKKRKIDRAKHHLNSTGVQNMTWAMLQERDPQKEIISWIEKIQSYLKE